MKNSTDAIVIWNEQEWHDQITRLRTNLAYFHDETPITTQALTQTTIDSQQQAATLRVATTYSNPLQNLYILIANETVIIGSSQVNTTLMLITFNSNTYSLSITGIFQAHAMITSITGFQVQSAPSLKLTFALNLITIQSTTPYLTISKSYLIFLQEQALSTMNSNTSNTNFTNSLLAMLFFVFPCSYVLRKRKSITK